MCHLPLESTQQGESNEDGYGTKFINTNPQILQQLQENKIRPHPNSVLFVVQESSFEMIRRLIHTA